VRSFLRTGRFGELPAHVRLPPPDFETPTDTSLFEQFATDARIAE
jgi:hypothetical protein